MTQKRQPASPADPPAADPSAPLHGRTVVLGVGGGIAAYKSAELVRLLRKAGATVRVVMTAAAQQFITPLTLQTLSGQPVATELFDLTQESEIGHIALADSADLLLIAPATADLLAKLSLGLAGDLLSTVALATRAPLLLAPAMNVQMWQQPVVKEHVERLRQRGAQLVGPQAGELACGWVGVGRLAEPAAIVAAVEALLGQRRSLAGTRVVIAAGPTYEALDPVRFIGNRSSGKMGFALAAVAAQRGATVTLVAGPVALPTPPGVQRVDVESAAEMAAAVLPFVAADAAEVIIMTAAVADFRPQTVQTGKLKKAALGAQPQLALVPTIDILAELGQRRQGRQQPLLVGFAAETADLERYAAGKLRDKRCDVIVANNVAEPGSQFGSDSNRVTLLTSRGEAQPPQLDPLPLLPKSAVAERIWDHLTSLLSRS